MLKNEIDRIVNEVQNLLSSPEASKEKAMPCKTFFLDKGDIVALPRDDGDSRYPYGRDGFNFWAYTSGYMHCNEGLYSLFLRAAEGQEPRIAFFAGMEENAQRYAVESLLPVPSLASTENSEVERYCVLTMNSAYYITTLPGLRFAVRVFATAEKSLVFSIHMENLTKTKQSFFVSSFLNPYMRHQIYESGEDRWFKKIRVLDPAPAQGRLGSFLVTVNEDKDRHHSITNYGVIRRGFSASAPSKLVRNEETTSRYQYVGGTRRSLQTPASLEQGTFGKAAAKVCTFIETAVAADLLFIDLAPGHSARLDLTLEGAPDAEAAYRKAGEALEPADIDEKLEQLRAEEAAANSGMKVKISGITRPELKADVFNSFFEHLKKQVEFCSLLKGYIQLSENSLIGIRDVFQALEAMLFWQPEAAKAKILEALDFTSPDGRCFRQYSLPSKNGNLGRMDLRPFIDQGAWVISCISTYLRATGDWDILKADCCYHRIVDEKAGRVAKADMKDSVLEHLLKIMDYLLLNRDHQKTHCVLALYGDWNDALDGLGISQDPSKPFGTGVSVMASLQVYQNLSEMIELLQKVNAREYAPRIEEYQDDLREIEAGLFRYAVIQNGNGEKRILHGWGDKRGYLVGSYYDPDGKARDGLTSNAFWILSGLYQKDTSLRPHILASLQRLDSKYGYKTFEPAFPPNTPGVGRIGKLPAGTAENGATYVHATAFAIMALFRMGCPKQAWEQLIKILPFTDSHDKLSHSPFVMPNSYGYNPEEGIDGQNMNDWQTGSSNVVMKLLIRYVFGYEPLMDGVWIQPAKEMPFKQFEFKIKRRGCMVTIRYKDTGASERHFIVNGVKQDGTLDEIMGLKKLWLPNEAFAKGSVDIQVMQ
jgi:cellobiose phosphorylase